MERVKLDLYADRHVPFTHDIQILGEQLGGSDLAMQIRLYRDAPGLPVVEVLESDLNTEGIGFRYSGTDTVANHIAAGRLAAVPDGLQGSDVVPLTVIGIFMGIKPWPFPAERGDDLHLVWDLQGRPVGLVWQLWFSGDFVVRSGVTEPQ